MSSIFNEEFIYNILSIVEEIPAGKVANYGQIAKLSGYDKNSRLVGRALKFANQYGDYPCHRVVNSSGRLTPGWKEQRELLLDEEITFKENGNVDMKKHKWEV